MICCITTGAIRGVNTKPHLDLNPDDLKHPEQPEHYNIVGLPACDEDEIKAEYLASELANRCVVEYISLPDTLQTPPPGAGHQSG